MHKALYTVKINIIRKTVIPDVSLRQEDPKSKTGGKEMAHWADSLLISLNLGASWGDVHF